MNLSPYIQIANAITRLFSPLAEVVIHDVSKGSIAHICGGLSKRQVGDDSLLDPHLTTAAAPLWEETPYTKLNFDGKLVQSISIPLRDEAGALAYIMCINCEVTVFENLQTLASAFLQKADAAASRPEALFKNDWQERLHKAIHQYIKREGWQFNSLNNQQKKSLLKHLFDLGAFTQKNAPDYLATILSMGRATIFKYLKNWR